MTTALDSDDLPAVRRLLESLSLFDDVSTRRRDNLSPSESDPDYRAPRWAETWQLCKELNISDDFAYAHKRELGASVLALPKQRSGRPMLRWDMEVARVWFLSRRVGRSTEDRPAAPPLTTAPRRSLKPRTPSTPATAASRTVLTPRPYAVP